MAYHLNEDEYYFQLDGPEKLPVRWLSPEAASKWKFSHASDVWAFAVTLWEICSLGLRPYKDLHNREIQKAVRDGRRLEKSPFACSHIHKNAKLFYSKIYALMIQAWSMKETERPTPDKIKQKMDKIFHNFL